MLKDNYLDINYMMQQLEEKATHELLPYYF